MSLPHINPDIIAACKESFASGASISDFCGLMHLDDETEELLTQLIIDAEPNPAGRLPVNPVLVQFGGIRVASTEPLHGEVAK